MTRPRLAGPVGGAATTVASTIHQVRRHWARFQQRTLHDLETLLQNASHPADWDEAAVELRIQRHLQEADQLFHGYCEPVRELRTIAMALRAEHAEARLLLRQLDHARRHRNSKLRLEVLERLYQVLEAHLPRESDFLCSDVVAALPGMEVRERLDALERKMSDEFIAPCEGWGEEPKRPGGDLNPGQSLDRALS